MLVGFLCDLENVTRIGILHRAAARVDGLGLGAPAGQSLMLALERKGNGDTSAVLLDVPRFATDLSTDQR